MLHFTLYHAWEEFATKMAQKMRKNAQLWTKIVISIFLLSCLLGCSTDKKSFLPELDSAFSCRVTGECCGEAFAAIVTAGAWETAENGARTRVLRVVYTAPERLQGVVATLDAGEYSLLLDGVQIKASHLMGFLLPARLLADVFDVTDTLTLNKEGRATCEVLGSAENGSRRVEIDGESGAILRVEGTLDGMYAEFDVENFERT